MKMQDGELVCEWMTDSPTPAGVLKSVHCKCKKHGCKGGYLCAKFGLPCTDLCQCIQDMCENQASDKEEMSIAYDSESEYDSDEYDD